MLRIELSHSITTCIKDGCDEEHAEMLLKSIIIMLNEWINRRVKAKEFIENTIPMIKVIKNA
jgi:hypothetical protein